jgi:hypothetical protein
LQIGWLGGTKSAFCPLCFRTHKPPERATRGDLR